MKYTKEERLDIGRRIYEGELTRSQAAEEYDINENTVRNYMRLYRDVNNLPPKHGKKISQAGHSKISIDTGLAEIESMSREELIDALVMARINEARLKKGYEVKGAGAKKEFLPIGSKNTK